MILFVNLFLLGVTCPTTTQQVSSGTLTIQRPPIQNFPVQDTTILYVYRDADSLGDQFATLLSNQATHMITGIGGSVSRINLLVYGTTSTTQVQCAFDINHGGEC